MDPRPRPFYLSIRFRLTVWYTTLLAIVIIAVGIGLLILVGRQLRADVDARLLRTAGRIQPEVNIQFMQGPKGSFTLSVPPLNPITSPGQVVQIIFPDGSIATGSQGSTDQPLPAAPLNDQNRHIAYRTADFAGTSVRTLTYPLIGDQSGILVGAIVVAESIKPVDRTLHLLERLLMLSAPIGLVVAAIGGWLLAGRALRPIDRITATAASIASGTSATPSLTARLDVPDTGDELARLASTFNRMLDRLEEAFDAQRRFVADASHELRTPLTAIRGNIDVLVRQASSGGIEREDLSDAMDDLRRESARMSRLIEDLLTLARTDTLPATVDRRTAVRLDAVAEDALRTASSLTMGQRLRLLRADPATVVADRDQITELLLILLDNAIRHTPTGGEIMVSVETAGTNARLIVRDTGEGIAPEHLPHVFERFYRAGLARDRASGGTGLGLAIAQSIVRLHGGEIAVSSSPGAGTAFSVSLPLQKVLAGVAPP
ncbi:MAG TPA: HAMP domain-containing sensor histidine kinase [Thermomicrobiales bacterium]|nr:HAMP domain-containing sensor histidine kinase [Thermomicrobiales bacterium]